MTYRNGATLAGRTNCAASGDSRPSSDGPSRMLGVRHLVNRLVAIGIERLPERIDPADAVLLERVEQPTLSRGHPS